MTMLLLAAALATGQDSGYFPVDKGTAWTYESDGKELKTVCTGPDEVHDVPCFALTIEVGDEGRTEWFAVGKEGVSFLKNRVWKGQRKQESSPDPAILRLKFGTKKGDSWEWKGSISGRDEEARYTHEGEEEVQVGAGKYLCVKVHTEAKGAQGPYAVDRWYAKGVGLVKSVVKAGDKTTTTTLKKFEPAKKEAPKDF